MYRENCLLADVCEFYHLSPNKGSIYDAKLSYDALNLHRLKQQRLKEYSKLLESGAGKYYYQETPTTVLQGRARQRTTGYHQRPDTFIDQKRFRVTSPFDLAKQRTSKKDLADSAARFKVRNLMTHDWVTQTNQGEQLQGHLGRIYPSKSKGKDTRTANSESQHQRIPDHKATRSFCKTSNSQQRHATRRGSHPN